jgi:sugar/nucleoside kinase (ribokinase family)
MKSFDITLYGNISFDNIFKDGSYLSSVGCIGNVWKQLKLIDRFLKIQVEPTDFGESLILVDTLQSKRTSVSSLSLRHYCPTIHDSKVNHIMYWNEMANKDFVRCLNGFNSVDICNGKFLDLTDSNLKYVDLIFVSNEDVNSNVILQLLKVIRGNVLLHYTEGSILYTKSTETRFTASLVNNVNVLGAGDKFSSYVLYGILKNEMSLPNVIQNAHASLTEFYQNEKV